MNTLYQHLRAGLEFTSKNNIITLTFVGLIEIRNYSPRIYIILLNMVHLKWMRILMKAYIDCWGGGQVFWWASQAYSDTNSYTQGLGKLLQ